MTLPQNLAIPLLHMNGTSREGLLDPLIAALEALHSAYDAVAAAGPNPRDYYPLGPNAFNQAAEQHRSRLARLSDIREELNAIAETL